MEFESPTTERKNERTLCRRLSHFAISRLVAGTSSSRHPSARRSNCTSVRRISVPQHCPYADGYLHCRISKRAHHTSQRTPSSLRLYLYTQSEVPRALPSEISKNINGAQNIGCSLNPIFSDYSYILGCEFCQFKRPGFSSPYDERVSASRVRL